MGGVWIEVASAQVQLTSSHRWLLHV